MGASRRAVLTPSRGFRNPEDTQAEDERGGNLNGKRAPPRVACALDEIKPQPRPAGSDITNTDHDAVHANEKATNMGGRYLTLIKRYRSYERA